jgi:hypothetical protein
MRSTSAKKHHRHYHTFSCEVEQISTPASEITQLVPAELISLRPEDRTQNLYVLLGTKKSTNKTRTHWHYFHSYKKSLPPEGHRLLAWSSLRPPYNNKDITTIISSLTHTAILECGSDGSLSNRKGTFGYALSIDGKIFWHGAGPADGDTTTANSKRPELYGYAGCLEACLMILKVSKDSIRAPITEMTVRIWVDNASAHRHLNGLLTTRTHRTRYPNDPDILSHIQWLWDQLSWCQQEVRWVKAHQDKNSPLDQLPLNAKLNVIADQMATSYGEEAISTAARPRSQPAVFPTTRVYLTVNGQRTTGMYKEVMRFHINGTRLRSFLQSTHKEWRSHAVWATIDMDGVSRAFTPLPTTKRHQVSKCYSAG